MNTTEINGFEIEKFNQYELKVGATSSTCPLCSETRSNGNKKQKCVSLDWDRGIGTCHHCGTVMQLHTFKKRKTDKVYIKPKPHEDFHISERVCSYFHARGISKRTLQAAKVTSSPGWIHFNYYINDELVNIKSRDAKKNFRLVKGAEKVLYNIDSTRGHDYVIITEGEFDTLAAIQSGYSSAVSVPNGAVVGNNNLDYLDNCIDYFEGKSKVILAVDKDEAGQALQKELIRRLGPEICYICEFGGLKDLNEVLIERGVDHVKRCIDGAVPVPLENVKTIHDVEFETIVERGFEKGHTSGMDNIDSIFSILDHQFCVVTGIPSSGKSDFVDAYCMGLNRKYGWKTAYASPENYPIGFHAHKLFRKAFNGQPTKGDIGTDRYSRTKQMLADNFLFIDLPSFDLESVLKKGAELVKRKGIKCLVIDPYNKIKLKSALNDSINEYTNKYLNRVDEFARKHNCFVFLVAHPVKLQKKEDGTYPCPSFYDVKGGGEMYDMSPNGLAVHRDYTAGTTLVKVLKVKFQFQGENQGEAWFTWDKASGNYIPHEIEHSLPWEAE